MGTLKQETLVPQKEDPGRGAPIQGTPHKLPGREETPESRHA